MKRRLVAINYDKESYGDDKADGIVNGWGFDYSARTTVNDVDKRARESIFGDSIVTILKINDPSKDHNKAMLARTTAQLKENAADVVGEGIVILFSLPENLKEVKDFIETIKKSGGEYQSPKKNKQSEIDEIISRVSLNRETKTDLLEYVGESYDTLLPVVNSIKDMTPDRQRRLSFEDLLLRIPQKPGQQSPFGQGFGKDKVPGFTDYIVERNAQAAMAKLNRLIDGGTPEILLVVILRKRFAEMYSLKALLSEGVTDYDAAETLDLPDPRFYGSKGKDPRTGKSGYPTKMKIDECRGWSLEQLEDAVRTISTAEAVIKGKGGQLHMAMDPPTVMTWMIGKMFEK